MAVFVVCGPSGVGKTTIIRRVLSEIPELVQEIPIVTRAPRPDDPPGEVEYANTSEFLSRVVRRHLWGWSEYAGNLHGVLKSGKPGHKLFEIVIKGAFQAKRSEPSVTMIFILPPGRGLHEQLSVLLERHHKRGLHDSRLIHRRLEIARDELNQAKGRFDYFVVNDNLDRAVEEIVSIIRSRLSTQGV